MRKILFILAVFAFSVAAQVYADDNVSGTNVSGTWVLTQITNMGGEDIWDVVITQDGENLNVAATSSEFPITLPGTGTLKGSKIKFSLKAADNPFELIFKGKVTGKKMEGTREIHDGRDDRGGTITLFLPGPSSDSEEPSAEPSADEIKNLNLNTWSAVMK